MRDYEEFEELEEIFELEEEEQKGFSIKDDSTADWALRMIAEEESEFRRLKAIADQQIEEIKMKIDALKERTERKNAFLKSCLFEYFTTVPHKETKTQETYKLLNGSLIFKKPKQKMIYEEDKLVEYFKQNGMEEFIKTEEKPIWGEFKKNLSIIDGSVIDTITGEMVDTVSVVEEPGAFEAKTS